MAYEESLKSITLMADSTIGFYTGVPGLPGSTSPNGGKIYHFVKVTGDRQAGLADTTSHEITIGVLQNKPQKVGDAATVGIFGVSLVEAGAAVTAGTPVKGDSTSRAVTATAGTDAIAGIALTGAGAAGALISVLLTLPSRVTP